MNSLVAQQQGYTFPMDEIPRTYYPGRGFLSDQEAYPENPFYRPPTYGGGMNVPGAPGNLQTLPYYGGPTNPMQMPYYAGQDYGDVQQLAADPSFQIPPTPQQLENRKNFDLFNDPRFPGARRTRHLIEDTLKLPRTPFAQGLPMGFQNKYVS